jgi:hypothetical protein
MASLSGFGGVLREQGLEGGHIGQLRQRQQLRLHGAWMRCAEVQRGIGAKLFLHVAIAGRALGVAAVHGFAVRQHAAVLQRHGHHRQAADRAAPHLSGCGGRTDAVTNPGLPGFALQRHGRGYAWVAANRLHGAPPQLERATDSGFSVCPITMTVINGSADLDRACQESPL